MVAALETKQPIPVEVDVNDNDLTVKCDVEPIYVSRKSGQHTIEFSMKNEEYDFVGFLSPQDMKHECFDVVGIDRDGSHSVMIVEDKFCPEPPQTYRYELIFKLRKDEVGGNLFNYDPQIRNGD